MSCSTALLPKDPAKKKKDDHPIFLRVCHAPWSKVGQQQLVCIRGIIALYLGVSLGLIINYEIKNNKHGWLTAFEFSNVVYGIQFFYAFIAFVWTYMHLHYPHHSTSPPTSATKCQKFLSPPRQKECNNNRGWFSLFYTAAVTFPLVVTLIHWAVLIPRNEATIPCDQIFGHGRYREFYVLSKNGVNAAIALIEVFCLSSIRSQTPVGGHIIGLIFLSLLYVAWAHTGYVVTDKYAYFFFNHKKIGWQHATAAIIAFVGLGQIFFAFIYGLTGIREKLTTKCEAKSGYQRLPQ